MVCIYIVLKSINYCVEGEATLPMLLESIRTSGCEQKFCLQAGLKLTMTSQGTSKQSKSRVGAAPRDFDFECQTKASWEKMVVRENLPVCGLAFRLNAARALAIAKHCSLLPLT